jgi:hypothetical protein
MTSSSALGAGEEAAKVRRAANGDEDGAIDAAPLAATAATAESPTGCCCDAGRRRRRLQGRRARSARRRSMGEGWFLAFRRSRV